MPREVGSGRSDLYEPKGEPIGARSLTVRSRVIDLSVARSTPTKLELAGKWLWAQDSSGLHSVIGVRFNEPVGEEIAFRRGLKFGHEFQCLYVTNEALGAGASITLVCAMQYADIENAVGVIADFVPARTVTHTAVAVGVAAVEVSALNLQKRRVVIQASRSNLGTVYLGITGVTTANGFAELQAGDSMVINSTAAIFAIASLAAQEVRVWTEVY